MGPGSLRVTHQCCAAFPGILSLVEENEEDLWLRYAGHIASQDGTLRRLFLCVPPHTRAGVTMQVCPGDLRIMTPAHPAQGTCNTGPSWAEKGGLPMDTYSNYPVRHHQYQSQIFSHRHTDAVSVTACLTPSLPNPLPVQCKPCRPWGDLGVWTSSPVSRSPHTLERANHPGSLALTL